MIPFRRSLGRLAAGGAAVCIALGLVASPGVLAQGARKDASRPDGDRLLTPAQLKACVSRKEEMLGRVDAVQKEKTQLDADKDGIMKSGDELAAELTTIDRASAEAVDGYNVKVGARDKAIEAYQARVVAYNERAEAARVLRSEYESACENRRYDERDLADIQKPEPPKRSVPARKAKK